LEKEGFNPRYIFRKNHYKWKLLRKPALPEFSFEDISYVPSEGTRLSELFRDSGLQIIVKLASIELTPGKSDFPVGGWHVEGQMNECICDTALYYLDSENITDTILSFACKRATSSTNPKGRMMLARTATVGWKTRMERDSVAIRGHVCRITGTFRRDRVAFSRSLMSCKSNIQLEMWPRNLLISW
jgi:hypothetical protein